MELNLVIDKDSETPIYRQLIEQITTMSKEGILKAGDKLPPERELANTIGTARGTIKKAYEELERSKVIEVIQGSGSFIARGQETIEEGRKGKAIKLIDELLTNLENLKFTHREMSIFINIKLMEREKLSKRVRIAAVDCNPEALYIFKKQLSYISNIDFIEFLLEDLGKSAHPEEILQEFDLILTTSTHYGELHELLPSIAGRIIQAAVSPSQQTIIDIAKIPMGASIGIICTSRQFLNIIQSRLKSFDVDMTDVQNRFVQQEMNLGEFLKDKKVLIVPPDFLVGRGLDHLSSVAEFKQQGGQLIKFDYQIERGSMIYIEEQIAKKFDKK